MCCGVFGGLAVCHHHLHRGCTTRIITASPESSRHHQNHHGFTRIITASLESSRYHQNHRDITRIITASPESLRHYQKHGDITRIIRASLESSTLQATKEVQTYNIITSLANGLIFAGLPSLWLWRQGAVRVLRLQAPRGLL